MKNLKTLVTLALMALMLLLPGPAFAESMVDVQCLVLTQTDGTVSKFALDDEPVITYSGGDVVVSCGQRVLRTAMDGVASCSFATEKMPAGIDDVKADEGTVAFAFGSASFDGLAPGSRIAVYTLDGKVVANTVADGHGSASISLASLGHGVYILHTPRKSYKVKL